jgi:DNA-binding beta-propeller fold protein YncE
MSKERTLTPCPLPHAAGRRSVRSLLLCLLVAVSGCGTPAPPAAAPPAEAIVWPKPPDAARIRYVRSVSGARDWGIERSWLGRLADRLAGRREERFARPTGVAVLGRVLYVADPGAHAVWILDAEQERAETIREVGEQALASPVAVAVRPDGSVYVADSVLKRVFLLGRTGRLLKVAAEAGLEQPAGLAYEASTDRLFVADSAAHRVVAFDAAGHVVGSRGEAGSGVGEFNHPTHLSLDRNATLLVTDALNFRIQAIGSDGRFLWSLGHHGDGSGDLATPKGVAADRAGHVYVADALFDTVQIFAPDGTFLLAFGGHGEQPGQFWLPNGLFIDSEDRLYVADAYNRRIQVFEAIGADKESTR